MKQFNVDSYIGISMEEFLINYVDLGDVLTSEVISKLSKAKATHYDLTLLGIPYIKRIPYEEVNQDDLLMGRVILVNDFKGNKKHPRLAPYIRPSILKEKSIILERKKDERNI